MNGRPWTPDDTACLRRLAARGEDDTEIGRQMGRDRPFIAKKRKAHNIQRGVSRGLVAALARINLQRMMART